MESEEVVLILEICFSGVFSNVRLSYGKWILTSSSKMETTHSEWIPVWQKESGGNIFTNNLIKAFGKSKDGSLQKIFKKAQKDTISLWRSWAHRINTAAWEKTLKWQTPQIYPENRDLSLSSFVKGSTEISDYLKDCFEFKIAGASGISKLRNISSDDILHSLGKPQNRNYGRYFIYDGIEIYFVGSKTDIYIKKNKYKMKKSLNIGTKKHRIIEMFGTPHETRISQKNTIIIYYSEKFNKESKFIEFHIEDKSGTIVGIYLRS